MLLPKQGLQGRRERGCSRAPEELSSVTDTFLCRSVQALMLKLQRPSLFLHRGAQVRQMMKQQRRVSFVTGTRRLLKPTTVALFLRSTRESHESSLRFCEEAERSGIGRKSTVRRLSGEMLRDREMVGALSPAPQPQSYNLHAINFNTGSPLNCS